MGNFLIYLQLGLEHILDLKAYDHIMFVIALTIMYNLKEWKNLLVLITAFTIGHSLTLALTVLELLTFNSDIIEILIILSISITAIFNIVRGGKTPRSLGMKLYYTLALLFGFIHGMGFASYLKAILGRNGDIILPLFGFNIGLEIGQIIIVFIILVLSYFLNKIFKTKREQFVIITSSIILGVTIHILLEYDLSWIKL